LLQRLDGEGRADAAVAVLRQRGKRFQTSKTGIPRRHARRNGIPLRVRQVTMKGVAGGVENLHLGIGQVVHHEPIGASKSCA
jgi:hypothetical protein